MGSSIAGKSVRVDVTTVAKAFAICLVVFTHADWADTDRLSPFFPFVVSAAVPLFMLVTGLNYARSYRRREIDSLPAMYGPSMICRRVCALVLPFVPIFLIEVLIATLKSHLGSSMVDLSPAGLFVGFVSGGWGPGGYYLPVMIQVIVVYPILYCFVRRFGWGAFAGVSLGCFSFDCAWTALGLSPGIWRLLCFRYLPYLAFGALLALAPVGSHGKAVGRGTDIALLAIGGGYLVCLTYGPVSGVLSTLQSEWSGTSLPSAFFFMGAFGLLYARFGGFASQSGKWGLVELISKSTWFIFLIQSVWYFAGANSVFDFVPVPVAVIAHLVVCLSLGCAFGWAWGKLRKAMKK